MIRRGIVFVVLSCAVGIAAGQTQVDPNAPTGARFVEVPGSMEFSGRVIVRPIQPAELEAQGLNDRQVTAMRALQQVELAQYQLHVYEPLVDHHVLYVPDGLDENKFVDQLMVTGFFEFAEPDWTLYPINCPNDTFFFSAQWHHDADHMQSCDAWDIHTGTNAVTVGICDTGIETSHPDLQANRQLGYNAVNRLWENQGGSIGPVHPHGTQTTGCAAANGNNGIGVAGVGWNLGHRMMRVSNSSSGSASLSVLTHAALTSIQAGDKVANVSYSGVNSSSVRSTATQIKNLGGLLIWSAGNNGANLNWGDRDNDDVIVVGATTEGDGRASFSAFGRSVDLFAPGASVASTTTGANYAYVSGTSFSAPLTAGLAGLIWSYNPSLSPDEVEQILKNGCDDIGAAGVDNTFGYGRINSFGSIQLAGGGDQNTPPTVTIDAPANGSSYTEGDSVTFTGSASDAEDGNLTGGITWTSSLDGAIGSGGSFSTSSLSVGTHVVTASVSDSENASDTDTVTVFIEPIDVNTPPTVTITAPANGSSFTEGNSVTFAGSANDAEDGNLTGGITWTSSRDGAIGSGGSFSTSSLSVGTHVITARVSDSENEVATDTVSVTIEEASGGVPDAPDGVRATNLGGRRALVEWNDNSNNEAGFTIQRERYQWFRGWRSTTNINVAANTTSYTDNTGRRAYYRYRVRATSGAGDSPWSAWFIVYVN